MTDSRFTPQEFQPVQQSKRKRGPSAASDGASTSFRSPNQYAVLSDSEPEDEEEINITLPDTPINKKRIPHIVIYSLLNNHSATLKRVNEQLTTPVDVKSKADSLFYTLNPPQITRYF